LYIKNDKKRGLQLANPLSVDGVDARRSENQAYHPE